MPVAKITMFHVAEISISRASIPAVPTTGIGEPWGNFALHSGVTKKRPCAFSWNLERSAENDLVLFHGIWSGVQKTTSCSETVSPERIDIGSTPECRKCHVTTVRIGHLNCANSLEHFPEARRAFCRARITLESGHLWIAIGLQTGASRVE